MAAKSPDKIALAALDIALSQVVAAVKADPSPVTVRRVRDGLTKHFDAVEKARSDADPISTPLTSFDPSDPKTVGRMVSLALLAQPMVPLGAVKPAYGSGVYAIYYAGDHPLYARISRTETPIYVGKADPSNGDASSSREQGMRLTSRLIEHAGTISTAEKYALENNLAPGLSAIHLADFKCRRLVCATNSQLVAERHLIRMFWPIWNSDTKACWGMSKHGDAASSYHGLLDWRLGLSFARAMVDPSFSAGADGDFRAPELVDWRVMAEDALARVARGASDLELISGAPLPAVRFRRPAGDVVIAIHHPLWRIEGVRSPLIDQMLAIHPGQVRWIDSFELARRPFHAISRLSF